MNTSESAPAKINWFLSVLGRREDGYHDIASAMQCVDLADLLTFEPADEIEVLSDLPIPVTENLVYRAALSLKQSAGYRGGARIVLRKEIPAAAGLGGGSSDAAATIRGLNRLWGLGLHTSAMMELGATIGSDIPFFSLGPLALVEGRGERVTALSGAPAAILLLVKPPVSVSTAWAYGMYRAELTKKTVDIKLFCRVLSNGDFSGLRRLLCNDLERVVTERYPVVGEIRQGLYDAGASFAAMSGSGSTVFGVFGSREDALRAAEPLEGSWCRVVTTLT